MKVNLENFIVVESSTPSYECYLYYKTDGNNALVKTYDEEWFWDKVYPEWWIHQDIRAYCKENGLELE